MSIRTEPRSLSQSIADNRYVQKAGDTMTGPLVISAPDNAASLTAGGLQVERLTASPNDIVNVVNLQAVGGTTNEDLNLQPKGTGALTIGIPPNNTATGGNKRGVNATDLQRERDSATQVASGEASLNSGFHCTASGFASFAEGIRSTAGGTASIAIGQDATANGDTSVCFGRNNQSNLNQTWIPGGSGASANNSGQGCWASSSAFGGIGQAQSNELVLFNATTDATQTELFCDGISERIVVPLNCVMKMQFEIIGVKETGTDGYSITYDLAVISTAAGAVTAVGTLQNPVLAQKTTGATTWSTTVTVAGNLVKVLVTGAAATNIRWVARVSGCQVIYF